MSDNPAKTKKGLAWHRVLGIFSIALACGVPLLYLPADIYAGSAQDFHYTFGELLRSVAAIAAIPVLLAVPLLLPWARLVRAWARAWFVAAALVWTSGYLLVLKMGPLDGRTIELNVPLSFTLLSTVALLFTGAAALVLAIRAPRTAIVPVLILNIAALGTAYSRVSSAPKLVSRPSDASGANVAPLFSFSKTSNVLVIILDTFQSDVFASILEEDSRLRRDLDGFQFFPDTVGPARSTYLALPAIHSGKIYDGKRKMSAIYAEDVHAGSFFAALANAGYDTTAVGGTGCAAGAQCFPAQAVYGQGTSASRRSEYKRLLDVALVRVAPAALKRTVFNNGSGLFQNRDHPAEASDWASRDLQTLQIFAENVNTSSQAPTAKLIHVMTSHPPVYLGPDCRPLPKPEQANRNNMLPQCRCAISAVVSILASLKEHEIYDNTEIFVIGDHGEYPSPGDTHMSASGWLGIVGAANPLLLWKPKNRRGALEFSSAQVQLSDLAATVCEETGACSGFPGVPLGRPRGQTRRVHVGYQWSDDFWKAETIPGVQWFAIEGPITSLSSWRRINAPELRIGTPVVFGGNPEAAVYLGWGWSGIEPWGVWTDSRFATISFSVPSPPTRPIHLAARVRWFISPKHPDLSVAVSANNIPITNWKFSLPNPARNVEIVLPPSVWSGGTDLQLVFEIDQPRSPASFGEGGDTRLLGLGLEAIELK